MSALPRILLVYAIAIPLAVILGVFLLDLDPNEMDIRGMAIVGLILGVLALPLVIQWHHFWLIVGWNATINVFFLPSQPPLWLLLAVLSFGISWLDGILGRRTFLRVPELTRPLFFLLAVVVLTALARGNLGSRVLGGSGYGGRNYIYVLVAIIGYFALAAERVPLRRAGRAASAFFLSGVTNVLPNLIFFLGPAFYILFWIFPAGNAESQAQSELGFDPSSFARLTGLTFAAQSIWCFLLLHYGVRGILDWTKPWRGVAAFAVLVLAALGGFRGALAFMGFLFVVQLVLEGLLFSRYSATLLGAAVAGSIGLALFSSRLPLVMQRVISYLPVEVDAAVRQDADFSTEWRLQMWRRTYPEIPQYLLLGKGYVINPDDMYYAQLAAQRGEGETDEAALVTGDYHSGPLSLIIPFGIWGMTAFCWLLGAGIKVLYLNYRHGEPALRLVNTLLLAFFIVHSFSYFAVYGSFYGDLYLFTGALGLSVCLNGGVCRKQAAPARPALKLAEPAPAAVLA